MFFFDSLKKMYILLQVVDIMRVNVDKVLERDQKISELDDRAGKVKDLKKDFDNLWSTKVLTSHWIKNSKLLPAHIKSSLFY